jgi:hypothetical protein
MVSVGYASTFGAGMSPRSVGNSRSVAGRRDRIAEADVNLDVDARLRKTHLDDSAQASVSTVFSDGMHLQGTHIENQAIVINLRRGNLTNGGVDGPCRGLSHAEKIEVLGRPVWFPDPNREQHCALQDELLSVR